MADISTIQIQTPEGTTQSIVVGTSEATPRLDPGQISGVQRGRMLPSRMGNSQSAAEELSQFVNQELQAKTSERVSAEVKAKTAEELVKVLAGDGRATDKIRQAISVNPNDAKQAIDRGIEHVIGPFQRIGIMEEAWIEANVNKLTSQSSTVEINTQPSTAAKPEPEPAPTSDSPVRSSTPSETASVEKAPEPSPQSYSTSTSTYRPSENTSSSSQRQQALNNQIQNAASATSKTSGVASIASSTSWPFGAKQDTGFDGIDNQQMAPWDVNKNLTPISKDWNVLGKRPGKSKGRRGR